MVAMTQDLKMQSVIDRIVEREVLVNASQMVSQLCAGGLCINSASFGELYHECLARPDYSVEPDGFSIEKSDDAYYWICNCDDGSTETSEFVFDTEEAAIRNAWDEIGEQPDDFEEALEHWIVSDWLADKLEDHDAMICRDVFGFNIWGRAETGQSLTMDNDLLKIAANVTKRI